MTGQELSAPDEKARCEEFAERISHYHDERWPKGSAECSEVEAHLAECPRCAELLDDYRAISGAARLVRSTDAPPVDAERMTRRVRTRLRGRVFRRRLKWAGAGVGFAAAAAAAVVALMILPGSPPPAGGGLVREETREAAEKPASDAADPADSMDLVYVRGKKRIDVVPPADVDELAREIEEKLRRIEESSRRNGSRPADGVRLVGEGHSTREGAPVPPRVVRPPEPPLLGVLLKEVARQPGDPVVAGVVAGSPAEKVGLRAGDIILSIDGQSVRGRPPEAVAGIIRRAGRGAKIAITYGRGGETHEVEVVLAGER
jgi:hypothetical protein